MLSASSQWTPVARQPDTWVGRAGLALLEEQGELIQGEKG